MWKRYVTGLLMVLLAALVAVGCTGKSKDETQPADQPQVQGESRGQGAAQSAGPAQGPAGPAQGAPPLRLSRFVRPAPSSAHKS